MSLLVGLAGAVVVAACAGPRGRRLPTRATTVVGRRDRAAGVELGAALVAVAAELRAGRAPDQAWSAVLGRPVRDAPDVPMLVAACGPARPGRGRSARRRRAARDAERAAAVVAATATARELGAPLAGVLNRVAEALVQDAEERDEVAAALAGPRATARVLAGLPLLGLALGALLGADPVGVLLGGGLGTTSGVAGAGLLLLGRRWTARLLARAERPTPAR
ncbi:type II secretion system F family protein [Cellulomonas gilvus]|uniref:Type II secretion system F domain protein n=1 Tax=Cellulomonas gilvus (strain ATCC 13127 / NRRL B-14078) TaxID=593907 RepID=F8A3D3_CELGA|nr:type II secretion system F family protein [Cellulomonas gilvus]AEI13126.1 Type II secretion system F domain protein [Cellulomonas gilvus ATCC 13127]